MIKGIIKVLFIFSIVILAIWGASKYNKLRIDMNPIKAVGEIQSHYRGHKSYKGEIKYTIGSKEYKKEVKLDIGNKKGDCYWVVCSKSDPNQFYVEFDNQVVNPEYGQIICASAVITETTTNYKSNWPNTEKQIHLFNDEKYIYYSFSYNEMNFHSHRLIQKDRKEFFISDSVEVCFPESRPDLSVLKLE